MKKLYIIRHGDSPLVNGMSDFERPLSELGLADAHKIGTYLKSSCLPPSLIISSAANRALSTATVIANEVGFSSSEILVKEALHNATMETVLNEITKTSQNIDSIMLFGHNPGLSYLASYLTGENFQMDTCNVVVLTTEINNWSALTQEICSIEQFITPNNI